MAHELLNNPKDPVPTGLRAGNGKNTVTDLKYRFIDLLKDQVSPVILKVIIEGALSQARLAPDAQPDASTIDTLVKDICRRLHLFVKPDQATACMQRLMTETGQPARPKNKPTELELLIKTENDVIRARRDTAQFVLDCLCSNIQSVRTATVVSELARNIQEYAGSGSIRVMVVGGQIEVIAVDQGPGISDVKSVLAGTFQTPKGPARGLHGVHRLARDMRVISKPGQGTMISVQMKG